MTKNISRLMRQSLAGAILVIIALLLISVTQAGGESAKARVAFHYTKAEAIQVRDSPGHFVGVAEARGLVFLNNGEVATYSAQITFDFTNGSGPHQGYTMYTYEDGSTKVSQVQGITTTVQGGKYSLFKGTYSLIKGSGRFEGIKGSGSYTGKCVTTLAAGADCYADVTGTYTLPSARRLPSEAGRNLA